MTLQLVGRLPYGNAEDNPRERDIPWFSTHPYWEPTANKGWHERGKYRGLTMEEMRIKAGGLVRFAYSAQKLIPWEGDKLRSKARMAKYMAKGLETTAMQVGSDPMLWFGTLEAIPLGDLLGIEIMGEDDTWVSTEMPEICAITPKTPLEQLLSKK